MRSNNTMNNLGQIAKHITRDEISNQCIPRTLYKHCISQKPLKNTRKCLETFYHGYDMHNITQIKYHTKNKKQT